MSTDQSDSDQDVVEDDSEEEEQRNVSPDSTVRNVREIDLFRSRSNSRSTVRSSSGYLFKYFDEMFILKVGLDLDHSLQSFPQENFLLILMKTIMMVTIMTKVKQAG